MRPILPLLVLLACTDKSESTAPDDSSPPDSTPTTDSTTTPTGLVDVSALGAKNLVVIHVDTLRRDHLMQYGYDRNTTPGMFARDWKVYTGAYSTTSWTIPATASALTGLIPEHHGAVRVDQTGTISEPVTGETLAEVLQAQGFATGFFSANTILTLDGGFDQGFDYAFLQDTYETVFLTGLATEATTWLADVPAEQPFFLWLQPMDMHTPYGSLPDYRGTWSDPESVPFEWNDPDQEGAFMNAWMAADPTEREALKQTLRDLYDEQLLSVDAGVTQLLDALAAAGRLDDTLVVFTADHGETLGDADDGVLGHGGDVRNELVALPWMMWHNRLDPAPVDCLSSNVDLMPTVLTALGVAAPGGLDGQSVTDTCRDYTLFDVYTNKEANANLQSLGSTDGRYAVNYDCFMHQFAGYDLAKDVEMLNPRPVRGDPTYEALAAPLDAYLADILAQYPTASCSEASGLR